jgi:hypothetical protein
MDKRTIDTLSIVIAQQIVRSRAKNVTGGEIIAAVSDELPGLEFEQASQIELVVQNKLKMNMEVYFSDYGDMPVLDHGLDESIAVPNTPHP